MRFRSCLKMKIMEALIEYCEEVDENEAQVIFLYKIYKL